MKRPLFLLMFLTACLDGDEPPETAEAELPTTGTQDDDCLGARTFTLAAGQSRLSTSTIALLAGGKTDDHLAIPGRDAILRFDVIGAPAMFSARVLGSGNANAVSLHQASAEPVAADAGCLGEVVTSSSGAGPTGTRLRATWVQPGTYYLLIEDLNQLATQNFLVYPELERGCSDGSAEDAFGTDMVGCGGASGLWGKATMCPADWHLCEAEEYVGNRMPAADVTWTDVVGARAVGNSLERLDATPGWSAGASSEESLDGSGYLELTVHSASAARVAGLGYANSTTQPSDIAFAIHLTADGKVHSSEHGTLSGQLATYIAGDTFRVHVEGTTVTYWRNGGLLRTSTQVPLGPMRADVALADVAGGAVSNVRLASAGPAPTGIYWTADSLKFSGSGAAAHVNPAGSSCPENQAFRVGTMTSDGAGNTAANAGLGFGNTSQHKDFASCGSTAGVLCCRNRTWASGVNMLTTAGGNQRRSAATIPVERWVNGDNDAAITGGNSLRKSVSQNSWSAGLSSGEKLGGPGHLTFSPGNTTTARIIGFNTADTSESYTDINYGLYLTATGTLEVYEEGVQKWATGATYAAGDVLKIDVGASGTVKYYRGATLLYSSATAAAMEGGYTYNLVTPMVVDVALHTGNSAALNNIQLTHTGSYWNSGADGADIIEGNGTLSFRAPATGYAFVGLTGAAELDGSRNWQTWDFAWYFGNGGVPQIYENNVLKFWMSGGYNASDRFAIATQDGVVRYYKNGAAVYTSTQTGNVQLVAQVSISSAGTAVRDVTVVNDGLTRVALGQGLVLEGINYSGGTAPPEGGVVFRPRRPWYEQPGLSFSDGGWMPPSPPDACSGNASTAILNWVAGPGPGNACQPMEATGPWVELASIPGVLYREYAKQLDTGNPSCMYTVVYNPTRGCAFGLSRYPDNNLGAIRDRWVQSPALFGPPRSDRMVDWFDVDASEATVVNRRHSMQVFERGMFSVAEQAGSNAWFIRSGLLDNTAAGEKLFDTWQDLDRPPLASDSQDVGSSTGKGVLLMDRIGALYAKNGAFWQPKLVSNDVATNWPSYSLFATEREAPGRMLDRYVAQGPGTWQAAPLGPLGYPKGEAASESTAYEGVGNDEQEFENGYLKNVRDCMRYYMDTIPGGATPPGCPCTFECEGAGEQVCFDPPGTGSSNEMITCETWNDALGDGDFDMDDVPDDIEQALLERFKPTMYGMDNAMARAYGHPTQVGPDVEWDLVRSTDPDAPDVAPATAAPLTASAAIGDLADCRGYFDEERRFVPTCLILRYTRPYKRDLGDPETPDSPAGHSHDGDSEFYAVIVAYADVRIGTANAWGVNWEEAREDASVWRAVGDWAAAHAGVVPSDSSECRGHFENPMDTSASLYVSVNKHASYFTGQACGLGGAGFDSCDYDFYNNIGWNPQRTWTPLIANAGELGSHRPEYFVTSIPFPYRGCDSGIGCEATPERGIYDVWSGYEFAESTPLKSQLSPNRLVPVGDLLDHDGAADCNAAP